MVVKIILGVLFWPYGLYLLYIHFIKGDSLTKSSTPPSEYGEDNSGVLEVELSDEEKKYYIPQITSTKKDIVENIDRGVFIPVSKLVHLPTFKSSQMNTLYNNKLSKGVMKNSYSKNLLLLSDRMIITNSNTVMGKLGNITGSGENEVYYDQITSVKFKDCNKVHNGYISVTFPGKESVGTGLSSVVSGASPDPYSVYFFESLNSFMREVKVFLQEKSRESKGNSGNTVVNQSIDPTLQLEKLNELKDKGIITEEEFQEKKKSLLDKL